MYFEVDQQPVMNRSRNYLKPTAASMNRRRAALSDVTSQVANRKNNSKTLEKKFYNAPHASAVTSSSSTLKDSKDIYAEKRQNIPSRHEIYNENNLIQVNSIEEESNNCYNNTLLDNDEEMNTEFSIENINDYNEPNMISSEYDDENNGSSDMNSIISEIEIIEPLLPHYDAKTQDIINASVDIYFSPVPDPEDEDTYDPVMMAEYSTDIINYMRELELKFTPKLNYIDSQPQINWSHRSEIIDWIIKVHERFQLLPETLFLTVNIMDRFLSKKIATLNRLQLLGITALFIACKYEEIHCPTITDLIYMLDNEYDRNDILQAEAFMIDSLNFEIGWPGPMSFLRRVSKADSYEDSIRALSKYFLESTLMNPRLVAAPASWLAAGSYFLSRIILKDDSWSYKHTYYSGYTREQLLPLVIAICEDCKDGETNHEAICTKYTSSKYQKSRLLFQQWVDLMQS